MREMKDSGVPWIGKIPVYWKTIRLKYISKLINGFAFKSQDLKVDGYYKVVRIGDLNNNKINLEDCLGVDVVDNYRDYKVCMGDALVALSGATVGKVAFADNNIECYINQRVGIIRSFWSRLIFHIFSVDKFIENLKSCLNDSAQPNLSIEDIGRISIPIYDKTTIKRIVRYLDDKCAQIDTIIAKEQSVIEKLQEYKQSVITEAVTSGLDSTTSLVPSGVEWIARIPLNWKITRFTMSFEFFKGLNIKKTDLVDSGACVVSYGQVHAKNNNGYSLQDDLIRYVAEDLIDEKSLLQEGDFVFADTSEDLEGVGNCIHIDSSNEVYAGYHTLVARCLDNSICTKYFAFLFLTDIWRSQLRRNANGTKVYSVTQKMFKAVSCLVPPIEEQLKIVVYLEQKCDAIDRVISHKLTIIDTLTEYKKSLIYEVVTGKKEVPHD